MRAYEASDDDGHYQEFSNDDLEIDVTYSSGTCSDDPDDDEASDIWNVPEWKVTRIEISLEKAIKFREIGLDPSKFKRNPRYPDDTESFVFHDKVLGLAFKTTTKGLRR